MESIKKSHSPNSNRLNNKRICIYCHADLNPMYYFCLRYATPYKDLARLIPVPVSRPITDGESVRAKAPHVINFFWTYFGVVLLLGIVSFFLLKKEENTELFVLFPTIGLAIFTVMVSIRYWQTLIVPLKKFGLFDRRFLWSLVMLAGLLVVNYFKNLYQTTTDIREKMALTSIARGYILFEYFNAKQEYMPSGTLRIKEFQNKELISILLPYNSEQKPKKIVLSAY